MQKGLSLGKKLVLLLLLIGLVPLAVIGFLSILEIKEFSAQTAVKQVVSIREAKREQVESYFSFLRDEVIDHSMDVAVVSAMEDLGDAFSRVDNELTSAYEAEGRANEAALKERYAYQREHTVGAPEGSVERWWPGEKLTRILQHLYISSNPNPVERKHELDLAPDGSTYSGVHAGFHPRIRQHFGEDLKFRDVFLVEPEHGYVVYSMAKELDFATSLMTGPYKDTGLARVFRSALAAGESGTAFIEDFAYYEPSFNRPAAFMASPIFKGAKIIGVLVFQIPVARINDIMTSHRMWKDVGLGNSVENYLVGADFTMRSDSRFLIETPEEYFGLIEKTGMDKKIIEKIRRLNTTILLQEVRTAGTVDAMNGNAGSDVFEDYRNERVFSAYTPLDIEGLKWVLVSEIDEAEALRAVNVSIRVILLAMCIVGAMILIAGIVTARSISAPVLALSKAADEIGKGNLKERIELDSKDEIGHLANSFNRMVERLEESGKALRAEKEDLKASEFKYRSLFENMVEGFAYCKMSFDKNRKPVDFVYLDVNDAFERLTGLKKENVLGKNITEVIPGIKEAHPELFEIYGKVALTGEETQFDIYFEPLDIWLSISVYSPGEGYFVAVFDNITERRRAEEELKKHKEHLEELVQERAEELVKVNERLERELAERKQAEETLIRFKTLIDNTSDLAYICDNNGNILHLNKAFEKLTGFRPEEFIGSSFAPLFDEENMEKAMDNYERTLSGESPRYELYFKDTGVLCEYKNIPLKDGGGNIIGVIGIARDITERMRIEEELRKHRENLEELVQERTTELKRANEALAREITERKRAEEALSDISSAVGGVTGEEFLRVLAQTLSSKLHVDIALIGELCGEKNEKVMTTALCIDGKIEENFEYDLAGTPCDGVVGKTLCFYPSGVQKLFPEDKMLVDMGIEGYMGSPLSDSEGRPMGILCVLSRRPIENLKLSESMLKIFAVRVATEMERKRAEDALVSTRTLLERIFASLNEAVFVVDMPARTIIKCNQVVESMLGYGVDEVVGRTTEFLHVDKEKYQEFGRELLSALDRDDFYSCESEMRRKDGVVIATEHTVTEIKDDANKRIAVVSVVRDITERKRAEEALGVSEERLRNAKRMEMIGNLAAGVAHEVRNPLTTIMATTDALLRDFADDREYRPYLTDMRSQADRLSKLMRDLLEFGKTIEPSFLEPVSISEVCTSAIELCKQLPFEKKFKVRLDHREGPGPVEVLVQSDRLEQVFQNLLENAIHHSADGGEIVMVIDAPRRGMCTVRIVDRGPGIPEDVLAFVFDPFFSVRRGGTGLGLSIVKNIVESFGGKVAISNNDPPPGCQVEVTLNLAKSDKS